MSYSADITQTLTRTISKFATLNAYQLAGHAANLDFWTGQVRNALHVIDGFESRNRKLVKAQKKHIRDHDTRRFDPQQLSPSQVAEDRDFPEDAWPLKEAVADRNLIVPSELADKRRDLVDAFNRFILRCQKENIISAEVAENTLAECGLT